MKTICRLVPAMIILMPFLFSCGKNKEAIPTPGEPEPTPVKTVDSIKITSQQKTLPVAPKNPGDYNVWLLYSNSRIYCISPSNTPHPQFMYYYSVLDNTYKLITPSDDVASAGFMSKLIRASDVEFYYIASKALKYNTVADSWSEISYPSSVRDNNGETGVIYYGGKIYFLGGRIPSQKFKSYNIVTGSWFNEPDFLHNTRMAVMVAISNDNKLYVIGGGSSNRDFSVFDIVSNSWKALPNLSFDVATSASNYLATTYASRYILLLQQKSIYIYDTKTEKWKKDPIELNIVGGNLNIFTSGIKVYITGKNPSNDLLLHELIITDTPD